MVRTLRSARNELKGHEHGYNTAKRVLTSVLWQSRLAGALVALRHAWLLRHPDSFMCGISAEERFLNALPLAKWWPSMFEANGDCALIKWRFLTLTIAAWSLIVLLLLALIAVYLWSTTTRQQR